MKLLLVEDNIHEADLLRSELQRSAEVHFREPDCHLTLTVDHVETGHEAYSYLEKAAADGSVPDVIVLDLNLPGIDGHEVLSLIRKKLKIHSPVIVLTTSQNLADVTRVYEAGASCYVPKPVDLKEYRSVTTALAGFWFGNVAYPNSLKESNLEPA